MMHTMKRFSLSPKSEGKKPEMVQPRSFSSLCGAVPITRTQRCRTLLLDRSNTKNWLVKTQRKEVVASLYLNDKNEIMFQDETNKIEVAKLVRRGNTPRSQRYVLYASKPMHKHQKVARSQADEMWCYKWAEITECSIEYRKFILTLNDPNKTAFIANDPFGQNRGFASLLGGKKIPQDFQIARESGFLVSKVTNKSDITGIKEQNVATGPGIDACLMMCFIAGMEALSGSDHPTAESAHA